MKKIGIPIGAAYHEKQLKEKIPFDPEKQYAVVRSSICTGEKLAGFKNIRENVIS